MFRQVSVARQKVLQASDTVFEVVLVDVSEQPIEHIFHKLKVFRILSEKYRNRRKRFALRFNLIAAIYNLKLTSY